MGPPDIDFKIAKLLHNAIAEGRIRSTALYATFNNPLQRTALNLWQTVDLSSRATRAYNVHWEEDTYLVAQRSNRHVQDSGYLIVLRLSDASIFEPPDLTTVRCSHRYPYSPRRCSTPAGLEAAFADFRHAESTQAPSVVPTRNTTRQPGRVQCRLSGLPSHPYTPSTF